MFHESNKTLNQKSPYTEHAGSEVHIAVNEISVAFDVGASLHLFDYLQAFHYTGIRK
jgi:hypothetical protein